MNRFDRGSIRGVCARLAPREGRGTHGRAEDPQRGLRGVALSVCHQKTISGRCRAATLGDVARGTGT